LSINENFNIIQRQAFLYSLKKKRLKKKKKKKN